MLELSHCTDASQQTQSNIAHTHTHTHCLSNELNNGITNYREFTSVSLSGDFVICDLVCGCMSGGNELNIELKSNIELHRLLQGCPEVTLS